MEELRDMSFYKSESDMTKCPKCKNLVIDITATGCPYCEDDDDGERTFNRRLEEGFDMIGEDDEKD